MTTPSGAILLGYGGSDHSKIALEWADGLAAQLSRPLHVLVSAFYLSGGGDEMPQHRRAVVVEDELAELLEKARAPQASVTTVLNAPGESLARESEHAHITVLGARTQGPLKSMVTGSVSQHVVRHATGPVVIVREPHAFDTGTIAVGVDGSRNSELALDFAIRHARATGARVTAVHVQHSHADDAATKVSEIIEAHQRTGDVPVHVKHVQGSASEELAEASREADLLVVGTRGRRALSSLVLGSVSQAVLQHAQCPVAVIR